MTNGWQTVPLGEFLTQRKGFFTIDDFTRYKRARVQLHGRGIVLRDEVDGAEVKTKEQQAARTGEFLVAEIDAKVGGFGIVPPELDGAIVSSHYFLFEINEQKCLREWLDWLIRSGMLEDQVIARGSTNYSAIRPSHVLKFEIPLPPLTEQRRIVGRIEALAARIAEAQRLSIESIEMSSSLIASTKRKVFIELSQKYPQRLLGELYNVVGGGTPSTANEEYWTGDIPWITSADIHGLRDIRPRKRITQKAIQDSATTLIPANTIIVVTRVSLGKVALAPFSLCFSQDSQGLIPKDKSLLPDYAVHFLSHAAQAFKDQSRGTTISGITKQQLKNVLVPVPPLEEQRRLVAYLDGLKAQVSALRVAQAETGKELSALMPSVLDRAFKGEL